MRLGTKIVGSFIVGVAAVGALLIHYGGDKSEADRLRYKLIDKLLEWGDGSSPTPPWISSLAIVSGVAPRQIPSSEWGGTLTSEQKDLRAEATNTMRQRLLAGVPWELQAFASHAGIA